VVPKKGKRSAGCHYIWAGPGLLQMGRGCLDPGAVVSSETAVRLLEDGVAGVEKRPGKREPTEPRGFNEPPA